MLAAQKDASSSSEVSRGLMERFSAARRESDALFDLVREQSLYERPIAERHRIIFYVGHLEAFDWNLLNGNSDGFGLTSANPSLDRLFAFGIDPVGGGLPSDVPSDWPALEAVRSYVSDVRRTLDAILDKAIVDVNSQGRNSFPLATLLNVAVEHRLMHVETLAYMLHQLPLDMKVRPRVLQIVPPHKANGPIVAHMMPVPAGSITLGLSRDSATFGWDNEYEAQTVDVPAFEIDLFKVTNRQYLEFIAAGGYDTRALWTDDDWDWKTCNGISHPKFWEKQDDALASASSPRGRWSYRTMFDRIPFDEAAEMLDWPVYVSQAEASAYARWAGKSLPTEAEWQRAAYGTVDGGARQYPWGSEPPKASLGNFDLHHWDPMPVNSFPRSQSAFGVHDLLGNGWEWTSTAFAPFPGFDPFPFYRGYSADFFDGKHFVMKGGSARTAACMLRSTFRNWFQPHYQNVYVGFRCVRR
ncbi:MAG TPA: SUMF1/EgtB/PvdO family nonheme iron enzyme [Terriglobales bacterium]|jgi:iron(II)-dependent oxidoreductase|nr:SUMF1/EgtB/PvdO family nonheme iron enzyme [Terriglobales bacterium]